MKKVMIVTGGIASGKSFVLEMMEKLGYPIMQSDTIAKQIMEQPSFLDQIKKILGKEEVDIKHEIESDSKVLDIIEKIIHPEIATIRQKFINKSHKNNLLPVIEIPLFFEKNIHETLLQYNLVVISTICGRELQITRAKTRSKAISDKLLKIVLSRQIDDQDRLVRSNFVVYTSLDKSVVKKQLISILNSIK